MEICWRTKTSISIVSPEFSVLRFRESRMTIFFRRTVTGSFLIEFFQYFFEIEPILIELYMFIHPSKELQALKAAVSGGNQEQSLVASELERNLLVNEHLIVPKNLMHKGAMSVENVPKAPFVLFSSVLSCDIYFLFSVLSSSFSRFSLIPQKIRSKKENQLQIWSQNSLFRLQTGSITNLPSTMSFLLTYSNLFWAYK